MFAPHFPAADYDMRRAALSCAAEGRDGESDVRSLLLSGRLLRAAVHPPLRTLSFSWTYAYEYPSHICS